MTITDVDRQHADETADIIERIVNGEQNPRYLTQCELMRVADVVAALRDAARRKPCPKTTVSSAPVPPDLPVRCPR